MEFRRRIAPRRISLLSCSQIRPPALQQLPRTATSKATSTSCCLKEKAIKHTAAQKSQLGGSDEDNDEDNDDDDSIFNIWTPLFYPRLPRNGSAAKTAPMAHTGSEIDDRVANVWRCLEVDLRLRRERAQQRKAARQAAAKLKRAANTVSHIAVKAGGRSDTQASNANRASSSICDESEMEGCRGQKRKGRDGAAHNEAKANTAEPNSEVPKPESPRTPSIASKKPRSSRVSNIPAESLLIPSLLPRGLLKSDASVISTRDHAPLPKPRSPAQETTSSRSTDLTFEPDSSAALNLGLGLDLDLDLGFDIAKTPTETAVGDGVIDLDTSIMEIADFLEKDVDVFTPMAGVQKQCLSALSSDISAGNGQGTVGQKGIGTRGLFEDILGR
ncbi:hypothetical protein GGI12_000221 [Dipsacomyces acuminosporus]|nr:hypothetical protein GGI12_000221 [Dipsacomyces acuminosporus]